MLFLLASAGATSVAAQGEILPAQAIEVSVDGTYVLTVIQSETGNHFGIMVPVASPGMIISSEQPFSVVEGTWDAGSQELTLGNSYAAEATAGSVFGSGSSGYSLPVEALPVGSVNTMVFELPDVCQSVTETLVQELQFDGQPLGDMLLLLAKAGDRFGLSFPSVQNVQLRSDSAFVSIEGEYGLAAQVLKYGTEFVAEETTVGVFGQPSEFTFDIPELPSGDVDAMVFELPQECGGGTSAATVFGSQNGAGAGSAGGSVAAVTCGYAAGDADGFPLAPFATSDRTHIGWLVVVNKSSNGVNDLSTAQLVQGVNWQAGPYGGHYWTYNGLECAKANLAVVLSRATQQICGYAAGDANGFPVGPNQTTPSGYLLVAEKNASGQNSLATLTYAEAPVTVGATGGHYWSFTTAACALADLTYLRNGNWGAAP